VARKHKHPEHVNHERWLVSYADFITLLFAFFTTLYAISTVDAKKAGKLVFAMRAAFNLDFFMTDQPMLGMVPPRSVVPKEVEETPEPDLLSVTDPRKRSAKAPGAEGEGGMQLSAGVLAGKLQEAMGATRVGRYIKIKREPRGVVITLEEAGFFDSGSARLRAESIGALERLGRLLRDVGPMVRAEGHSDDQGSDASNWELSAQRALALVRHWIAEVRFPPDRLSAVGYGSHRPLVKEGTEEARARNRRVDLVVTSRDAMRDEPPR
jgi:chemotaxis protein MotB